MDWRSYYRRECAAAGARDAMRAWLERDPEPAVSRAVERGSVLSFPHTALAYAGPLQAAVVRAVFDARVRRILALGVLHSGGVSAYRAALDDDGPAPRRAEAFRVVRGAFLPREDEVETSLGTVTLWKPTLAADVVRTDQTGILAAEFSLDTFLALVRTASEVFGRPPIPVLPLYVGMTRDPQSGSFAIAEELADWMRPHVDAETAVVATGDLVHYGTAYGGEWVPGAPIAVDPLRLALQPEVEKALTAAFVERDWEKAYWLSHRRLGNDQREIVAPLASYLGHGSTFSLLSFDLSDYAAILDVAPPCFVASALVRYGA